MGDWLARLKQRLVRQQPAPSIPDGLAVYAVGDIHGRADLLGKLFEQIEADALRHADDRERLLIFLGDYIDRGLESKRVIDLILGTLPANFRVICLMGNHEQALLEFVDGESDGRDWLTYGGLETLFSYGVGLDGIPANEEAVSRLREAVKSAIPARHFEFLRRCFLTHTEGDYLFVHAGVRPGVPLSRQVPADLLWIRDEFLASRSRFEDKVVVHGHTICDAAQIRPHRINIDTGAFASGRLTALVLRKEAQELLSTGSAVGLKGDIP
jgi:serine/threonine protein phosphatase 1